MKLTKELQDQFEVILEYIDLKRFNRNIRTVILGYLKYELENSPGDFVEQHLADLEIFFNCLDSIQDLVEQSKSVDNKRGEIQAIE